MSLRSFPAAAILLCLNCLVHAQSGTGTVSGTVFDGQTGRPVTGASIAVNGQKADRNVTDADGKYVLSLTPGTYTLTVSSAKYRDVVLADVRVKAGETTDASTVMSSESMVTSIEVVERMTAIGASAEAMLQERKLSSVVSDNLSRQEMLAGTSSDAAGALEKVTGVSVVGEGFVYVRGLGERYSSTQLNLH